MSGSYTYTYTFNPNEVSLINGALDNWKEVFKKLLNDDPAVQTIIDQLDKLALRFKK